jgi:hypothetical protein
VELADIAHQQHGAWYATSVNHTIVLQQGCGLFDSFPISFALRGEAAGRLMSYGAFRQALG